jgi:tetratricopeptide (TPR) repeat protein
MTGACRLHFVQRVAILVTAMGFFCHVARTLDTATTAIDSLMQQAKNAEESGQVDSAIEKYDEIAHLNPNLPLVQNALGRLYFRKGRYPEAISALERALQLDGQLTSARGLIGLAYYQLGNYSEAKTHLSDALRLNPRDRDIEFCLARSLYELDDFVGAAELFRNIQTDEPQNAAVLYALGLTYMKLAGSALETLQRSTPDSYLVDLLLGKSAEAANNYNEAIKDFRTAISKQPQTLGLHYALGNAYALSGQYSEAIQEFRSELKLNSYDYRASSRVAELLLRESPEEALQLANSALALQPNSWQALLVRGQAYLELKNPERAIVEFRKVISLAPSEKSPHYQLAKAYRELGEQSNAEAELAIFDRLQNGPPTDDSRKLEK